MSIRPNGGTNPTAINFNGNKVTEVRFNGVHVWPDMPIEELSIYYRVADNGDDTYTAYWRGTPKSGYKCLFMQGSSNPETKWYLYYGKAVSELYIEEPCQWRAPGTVSATYPDGTGSLFYCFANNPYLEHIDLSEVIVPNGCQVGFDSFFENCTNLKTVNLTGWNPKSMYVNHAFYKCSSLEHVYVGPNWAITPDGSFEAGKTRAYQTSYNTFPPFKECKFAAGSITTSNTDWTRFTLKSDTGANPQGGYFEVLVNPDKPMHKIYAEYVADGVVKETVKLGEAREGESYSFSTVRQGKGYATYDLASITGVMGTTDITVRVNVTMTPQRKISARYVLTPGGSAVSTATLGYVYEGEEYSFSTKQSTLESKIATYDPEVVTGKGGSYNKEFSVVVTLK